MIERKERGGVYKGGKKKERKEIEIDIKRILGGYVNH